MDGVVDLIEPSALELSLDDVFWFPCHLARHLASSPGLAQLHTSHLSDVLWASLWTLDNNLDKPPVYMKCSGLESVWISGRMNWHT